MKSFYILVLLGLIGQSLALQSQNRVLVLTESKSSEKSLSLFLDGLKESGYTVTVKQASDSTLVIEEYGVFLYDHLVLYTAGVDELLTVETDAIIKFIDVGGNVILVGDSNVEEFTENVAEELGIHFNKKTVKSPQEVFEIGVTSTVASFTSSIAGKIKYKGTSLRLDQSRVQKGFLYSILETSTNEVLVAAFQGRNNARVLISGSKELFTDEFLSNSANRQFIKELTKWTFKEKSVLRISKVHHSKVGEEKFEGFYTVHDNVTFSFKLEELVDGQYRPFVSDDIQIEFRMVDPYVRKTFKSSADGAHSVNFLLPDVNGVYTFKVNYLKPGYTRLEIIERTPLRPFRHNQYERFLQAATPYYLGSLSMIFGVFIFSVVYLFQKDEVVKEKTQ